MQHVLSRHYLARDYSLDIIVTVINTVCTCEIPINNQSPDPMEWNTFIFLFFYFFIELSEKWLNWYFRFTLLKVQGPGQILSFYNFVVFIVYRGCDIRTYRQMFDKGVKQNCTHMLHYVLVDPSPRYKLANVYTVMFSYIIFTDSVPSSSSMRIITAHKTIYQVVSVGQGIL